MTVLRITLRKFCEGSCNYLMAGAFCAICKCASGYPMSSLMIAIACPERGRCAAVRERSLQAIMLTGIKGWEAHRQSACERRSDEPDVIRECAHGSIRFANERASFPANWSGEALANRNFPSFPLPNAAPGPGPSAGPSIR